MPAANPTKILKREAQKRRLNFNQAMAWAQDKYGKSRTRQLMEIAGGLFGRHKLDPMEYYSYGMFRPEFDNSKRNSYVSDISGTKLNHRLSPPSTARQNELLNDKLLCGYVLERAGFPVMPALALYSKSRQVRDIPTLASADDIAGFLRQEGALPCFGKPIDGSLGIGAASYLELTDDGENIVLGNGETVSVDSLCNEIADDYWLGYVFQPVIAQHADCLAVCGETAVGMLRVVTVRTAKGPELLYTAFKLPAKGEMIDAAAAISSNAQCLIDSKTGAILRAQDMARLATTPLEKSLATDHPIVGHRLPFVPEGVELSIQAHRLFPGHGLLGFDIALTPTGPMINEINTNPFHLIYQRGADRGLLNGDFVPLLEAAQRETDRLIGEIKISNKLRGFGKKRRIKLR